ncbi:MAG: purine-nucleoside phosphorylase [Clostridiales bacterium]|nr:purine-nucleoside phosphorylase [Clostridiales bacterium]
MMNGDDEYRNIANACERIREVFPPNIETAVILGSGLSELVSQLPQIGSMAYSEIPHFPQTTVEGHTGNLLAVRINDQIIYILQGRFHFYEGYSTREAAFPIRVLAELGVKKLILTNSSGGLDSKFSPGDLMVIKDHLSFFCDSPLRGANMKRFGPRFPDQTNVYDPNYIELALRIAKDLSVTLHSGVYAYMRGPQYETPAEIRALSIMGASAVGMSTVPEAIVASHCGMKILGLSCVSNMASGLGGGSLSHEEVMKNAASSAQHTMKLIQAIVLSDQFA